jgi:hypothetical protein
VLIWLSHEVRHGVKITTCLFSLVGRAPAQKAGGRGLESRRRLIVFACPVAIRMSFDSNMTKDCVRVAKEIDSKSIGLWHSKSIGLWPQGLESPRCRVAGHASSQVQGRSSPLPALKLLSARCPRAGRQRVPGNLRAGSGQQTSLRLPRRWASGSVMLLGTIIYP